jgi:hypothetical protein
MAMPTTPPIQGFPGGSKPCKVVGSLLNPAVMKPIKTKAEIRAELNAQVQQFLLDGGQVADIPRGVSGHADNRNPYALQGENPPKQTRTPVDEVLKALDARKRQKHAPFKARPRKKLITDDFGEPLRWVWIDE